VFVYGPVHGLFLVVSLVMFVVELWALIDAAIRPAPAYVAASKQTKALWVVILAVALLFRGFGLLGIIGITAAIIYLVDVRPAVRDASGGRGNQGGRYR
jgi:hypothetical protein